MNGSKATPRRQRSISYVPFGSRKFSVNENPERFPALFNPNGSAVADGDVQPFEFQVAGHMFNEQKKSIGMMKCKDGTVLKPVLKKDIGQREIRFYENLQTTTDAHLLEFKEFCTTFYGTRILNMYNENVEFMILDDVSDGMIEPCIIDVKIGRVTCEPTATAEKRAKEKEKYRQCKDAVSFCITGFQVHKITTDRVHRYDKEYGKKLNGTSVIEALKIFLNADANRPVCRELVVKLLSILWKIQKWARKQTSIRLYASSLLIAYDCKKLKRLTEDNSLERSRMVNLNRKLSRKTSFTSPEGGPARFSGQVSSQGPILSIPMSPPLTQSQSFDISIAPRPKVNIPKLNRSHSFHHNYNDFVNQVKKDYASTLKELINDDLNKNKPWFDIRIIDFGHTYASEDQSRDENYMEGIDSIVRIFESLLDSAI